PLPGGHLSVFVTQTGVAAGTPSHMAPEQFDDVKHVDVKADVYSFGVMLFQLITGRLPFAGKTLLEYKRLHQTVKHPERPTPFLELTDVVARCLEKNPSDRFADFSELREGLKGYDYDRYETYRSPSNWPPPVPGTEISEDELIDIALSLVELGQHGQALQA